MNLKFITLIHKRLTGQSTVAEDQLLQNWEQEKDAHKSYSEDLSNVWEASTDKAPGFQPNVEAGLARLKSRMQAETTTEAPVVALPRRSGRWMRVAAAVLVLVVAGFVGNKLMTPSVEMLAASTMAGETKTIELVDGSIVTLNEESTLSYPKSFDGNSREVKLNGEAFFDVERNPTMPFEIATTHAKVAVLGTSFNIRSKADESTTEVTVSTGKVELTANRSNDAIVLIAGEEGVYNHRSQVLNKSKHTSSNALSWMNNQLTFNKTPLAIVIRDLEHYFDVQIDIQNTQLMQCSYTSLFNSPELQDILKLLTTAFDMELEQTQKNSYQIKGGRCN